MGLFDKKYCDICGKEIKLLGNRKLDDGNMCKNCAAKLSPWFTGRRHTSVKDIKAQLAYRAKNETKVANFYPTKTIGKRYRVFIDEKNKQFLVSSTSKYQGNNPDVIAFSDVKDVAINVAEKRSEEYDKDAEGKRISFDPPKYTYDYTFKVVIYVNNPYFDDMSFDLTADDIEDPYSDLYKDYVAMCNDLTTTLIGKPFIDDKSTFLFPKTEEDVTTETADWFCPQCGTKNNGNFCIKCGTARPVASGPIFCTKCGEKIIALDVKFCPKCGNKVRD